MKKAVQYGLTLLAVVAIMMWSTGYNPFAGSGKIGDTISFNELKKLKTDKQNDGKRVAVIGHPGMQNTHFSTVMGRPFSVAIMTPDEQIGDHFELYRGTGKNEFYLPVTFKPADIKLYDNDGKEHPYDENVLISFTLKRVTDSPDSATGEYAWRYDQIRIDPVAKK